MRSLLASLRRLSLQRTRESQSQSAAAPRSGEMQSSSRDTIVDAVNRYQQAGSAPIAGQSVGGLVQSTAEAGSVLIHGDGNGLMPVRGEFRIIGPGGAADIKVEQGETMADVVHRINARSEETRVVAATQGNDLRLDSIALGSDHLVRVQALDTESRQITANARQAGIGVVSHAFGRTETLWGKVSAGSAGELVYHGRAGGVAAGTATFRLTGELGSSDVSLTEGESLKDVVARINRHATDTGIAAKADGNDLRLIAQSTGAAASVQATLLHRGSGARVTGVNHSQVSKVDVSQLASGSSEMISGVVHSAATSAELSLPGDSGVVTGNAAFQLTGSLGSVTVTVERGESLASAAARVNRDTEQTGVAATVVGDTILLSDVNVGSNSRVQTELLDAEDPSGFQIRGGDGNGVAVGKDAEAQINGVGLIGRGNQFFFHLARAGVALEFTSGFTGRFDPVTVQSTAAEFDVTGGDETGTAYGTDSSATINGVDYTSADGSYDVATDLGEYQLAFADGFSGAFDPISVSSTATTLRMEGVNATGGGAGAGAESGMFDPVALGRRMTFGAPTAFSGPQAVQKSSAAPSRLESLDSQIGQITARIRQLQSPTTSSVSTASRLDSYRRTTASDLADVTPSRTIRA